MDWLTFISTTIGQIISWPMAFVVTVLLLLPQFKRLIPMLRHARVGLDEIEVDFREEIEELEEKAEQAQLPAPELEEEPTPSSHEKAEERDRVDREREMLYTLAQVHPPSAVIRAWQEVEQAAAELVERLDLFPTAGHRSALNVFRKLRGTGVIDPDISAIADRLRHLRNSAAHQPEPDISTDDAVEYVSLAERLAEYLRQLHPSEGDGRLDGV